MKSSWIKPAFAWGVTGAAFFYLYQSVDWSELLHALRNARAEYVSIAIALTVSSYLLRSRRWQLLFLNTKLRYIDAMRVLFLGFFMNNILPARAGELVRAHMGSKVAQTKRTVVLATVASERLADGLTLSVIFALFSWQLTHSEFHTELTYVALFFGLAALGTGAVLLFRQSVFGIAEAALNRVRPGTTKHNAARYTLDRFKLFVNELRPLYTKSSFPIIALWSAVVWGVELCVYVAVAHAFDIQFSIAECVLFMTTVNFSSLIPAAPGAIGVIEAITKVVLVSIGIDPETALAMVITQHAIQYLVVGVPGGLSMLTWKQEISQIDKDREEQDNGSPDAASPAVSSDVSALEQSQV